MAEITNALMYETLKSIQRTLAQHSDEFIEVRADLRSLRTYVAAFLQHEVVQDGTIAEIRVRLDRIERRLELRD